MTPEELDFGDSNYADDSIEVIAKLKEEITQANHRYADIQNVCDDQAEEIKRLQKVISEPVESFGTPELLEWANGLQKIIADYPESERGELPFCMLMGSHLEKFAKSWNSPAMKRLEAERAVWIKHYQDNRKKHAALKKLGEMVRVRGKALVEERARQIATRESGDFVNSQGEHMYQQIDPASRIGLARAQLRDEVQRQIAIRDARQLRR